jgi:periplasmic mercuric ion binding protein
MKKLLLTGIAGFMFAIGAQAQKSVSAEIQTPTVQCEMCKNAIESYLRRVDGVTYVQVVYQPKDSSKRKVKVKYLADRTNIEMIKTSIANVGYKAGDIDANPESYSRLPKCCKKPEDGGGMPKH